MEKKIENLINEILKNKKLGISEMLVKNLKGKEFKSIFLIIKINKNGVRVLNYLLNLKKDNINTYKEIYCNSLYEYYIEFSSLEDIYYFLYNFKSNLFNQQIKK
jgi:hypothetical protein